MGIGGIGIGQLLIVLAIVLLLFGTKRLRGLGSDLGSALKGFKGAMREAEETEEEVRSAVDEEPASPARLDNKQQSTAGVKTGADEVRQ